MKRGYAAQLGEDEFQNFSSLQTMTRIFDKNPG